MSVRHISLVLDHLEAPAAVKLVALILADHANADGVCWPSHRRIAQLSCQSKESVKRHIRRLCDAGVLAKVRTGTVSTVDGQTLRITNAYRIEADVLAAQPSLLSTGACDKGVTDDPLVGVTAEPHRGSRLTPKPSVEPRTLTVSAVEPVDNPSQPSVVPGPGEQIGSFRRAGDVLANMGVGVNRAGAVE